MYILTNCPFFFSVLNYCYAYDGDTISSITDKTGEYRFLNLLDQTEFSGYYIIIVNYDGNEFTSIDIKDSDIGIHEIRTFKPRI